LGSALTEFAQREKSVMSEDKRWDLLWRGMTFVMSVVGLLWVLTLLFWIVSESTAANAAMLYVVPLVTGLVVSIAPIDGRSRVLFLWIAAAMLGIVSGFGVLRGFGLLFVTVAAAYVMATWMLNQASDREPSRPIATSASTPVSADDERTDSWRRISGIASLAGLASPTLLLGMTEVETSSIVRAFVLCAIPAGIGLVASVGSRSLRSRILLLWLAAGVASCVAVITIMSDIGLLMLLVMVAYLLAAWKLNEIAPRPARSRHGAGRPGDPEFS
jgi:hypothetical protein